QVAHHHCPAMYRLERRPAAERQRGPDGHAVERHLQIGARKPVAMNITGYRTSPSRRFIDLLPVDVLRISGYSDCQHHAADFETRHSTHGYLVLDWVVTFVKQVPSSIKSPIASAPLEQGPC